MIRSVQLTKQSVFYVILISIILAYSFNIVFIENRSNSFTHDGEEFVGPILNTIWEEPGIFIDDSDPTRNWSVFAAAGYPWFSGSGIVSDPYEIEEVLITSTDIEIRDSDAYFRIRNCEGTIILRNVENGRIDNNICTDWLGSGIIIEDSSNISITNNQLNGNKDYGLIMSNSNYNTIFGNTANHNGYHDAGIAVYGNYNVIKNNTAKFNDWYGISVFGENITITGNNLEQNDIGIHAYGFTTIRGNTVFNNTNSGMYIEHWGYNNITSNYVDNNGESGIYLTHSSNDTITNNIGYNNIIAGLRFEEVDNASVSNNALYGCGYQFEGSQASIGSIQFETSNLINDKPAYLYVNKDKLTPADFTNAGQVTLFSCENSTLSNLNVSNGTIGISLIDCVNVTVKHIDSSYNNHHGIYLLSSINNTIKECTLIENGQNNILSDGIYLEYSDNNTISGTTANNNRRNGIFIEYGDKNIIFDNTVNDNQNNGICTSQCFGNLILENSVTNNADHGIYLYQCLNSTVKGNTVSHHQIVICDPYCGYTVDQYGILIESSQYCNITENDSSENEIGISLKYASYNYLIRNHPDADLAHGIWLYYSDNNLILENIVENIVPFQSIDLHESNNNTIKKNELKNGGTGIELFSGYDNQIVDNDIDMSAVGISLRRSSYNSIINNTIKAGWACFDEDDDCIGNIYEGNTCEEGFYRPFIPGFNLMLVMLIFFVISIILLLNVDYRKIKS
ncbi:MAG: nitrous oxide reductase family maturation protein NosD [Promethearchaeota archaeon]